MPTVEVVKEKINLEPEKKEEPAPVQEAAPPVIVYKPSLPEKKEVKKSRINKRIIKYAIFLLLGILIGFMIGRII